MSEKRALFAEAFFLFSASAADQTGEPQHVVKVVSDTSHDKPCAKKIAVHNVTEPTKRENVCDDFLCPDLVKLKNTYLSVIRSTCDARVHAFFTYRSRTVTDHYFVSSTSIREPQNPTWVSFAFCLVSLYALGSVGKLEIVNLTQHQP